MTKEHETGFTLVETLVATAVLAVAAISLVRITGAHIDFIRELEARSAALWVAENRMAELDLPRTAPLASSARLLDHVWRITTKVTPANDPDLVAVEIVVNDGDGNRPIVTLHGFKASRAAAAR